jgi:large conductance mechanosensitive channel
VLVSVSRSLKTTGIFLCMNGIYVTESPKKAIHRRRNGFYEILTMTSKQVTMFHFQSFDIMQFLKRFKEFAIKGNVLDLAVGIIIGAAFTTVTQSLVNDIIMPPVGKIIDNVNFSNLYIPLDHKAKGIPSVEDARKAGAIIAYGNFLQNVINFLIISLAVFLLVNFVHSLRHEESKKPVQTPPAPTREESLLMEIRDAIKALEVRKTD